MHEGRSRGSDAHDLVRDGPVTAIEEQSHEVLARIVGDGSPHEGGDVSR